MPMFIVPNSCSFAEANDCHSPEDGKFCSTPGRAKGAPKPRKDYYGSTRGYRIMHRSQTNYAFLGGGRGLKPSTERELTSEELRKARSARVYLIFDAWASAHLGAPTKWKAPNGVTVVYDRGQRRSERGTGTYHDFNVQQDEKVVPLTRNVGSGRRALRAWAAEHMADKTTLRFQARQMVRSGD